MLVGFEKRKLEPYICCCSNGPLRRSRNKACLSAKNGGGMDSKDEVSVGQGRELSRDEARARLVAAVVGISEYWAEHAGPHSPKDLRGRIDRAGYSFLTLLDGYSAAMCAIACANKFEVDSLGTSVAARLDHGLLAAFVEEAGEPGLSKLAIEFGGAAGRLELRVERPKEDSFERFEFMGRLRCAAARWTEWGAKAGLA